MEARLGGNEATSDALLPTQVVPLKYTAAGELARLLQQVYRGAPLSIGVDELTNSLVLGVSKAKSPRA